MKLFKENFFTTSQKIFFTLLTLFSISSYGQTNAPSIRSGVTFQWNNIQANQNSAASIKSITINGEVYDDFRAPSGYILSQLGPNGHNPNGIILNGSLVEASSNLSTNPNWTTSALAAFQDRNLNHYFEASSNGVNICNNFTSELTTTSQRQTLIFQNTITSSGSILAVTERNANNCIHVEIFGIPATGGPEKSLGKTFVNPENGTRYGAGGTGTTSSIGTPGAVNPPSTPVPGTPDSNSNSDYWLTNRIVENFGTIGIALFELENIVPVGSSITKIRITAATSDHFDGKFFVLNKNSDGDSGDNLDDLDDDNDGILDIDERICANTTVKPANAIFVNNNVTRADRILTPINGDGAEFDAVGDRLVVDLGSTIPKGTIIKLQLFASNSSSKTIAIEESNFDGSSTTNQQTVTKTNTTSQNVDYVLTKNTKYIRLLMTNRVSGILEVDYLEIQPYLACTDIDTDGDLLPNHLDTDSDGDGCSDALEADGGIVPSQLDNTGAIDISINGVDANGVPNAVNGGQTDVSSTNPNVSSAFCDYDGDGIPENIDIDDDSDGILDSIESGGNDPDGDEDNDGIPNYKDTTDNGNGGPGGTTNYTDTNSDGIADIFDFDNDGIPNHLDIDSDNDGIPDNVEAQTTNGYLPPSGNDTDNDGLDDIYDVTPNGTSNGDGSLGLIPVNTDGTDADDFLDLDTDNDGFNDIEENGDDENVALGIDSDKDGLDDAFDNFNDSGIIGFTVNNGINPPNGSNLGDSDNDLNSGGDLDYRDAFSVANDSDNDGVPDNIDLDDDNDGILDTVENGCNGQGSLNYEFYNTNSGNTVDNIPTTGSIISGTVPNFNVENLQVASGTDANTYSIRYTGFINIQTSETYTFYTTSDDGSKLFIGATEVVDNDFLQAPTERSGTIALTPGIYPIMVLFYENTGGNVLEVRYSSPTISKQEIPFSVLSVSDCSIAVNNDKDGDGIINSLDLDSDNDGIPDVIEAGGIDANNDGRADDDDNNLNNTGSNGIPTSAGSGLMIVNSDSDTIPDFLDIDSDNDGIPDNIEAQTTQNYIAPSGTATSITDLNNNGLDDNYEIGGNVGLTPINTDNTDNPDYLDTNSDNDSLSDIFENGDTDNVLSGNDADNDGLDDNFDDNDDSLIAGSTVNDGINPPNASNLGDEDNDITTGGDLDYRDFFGTDTDNDTIPDILDLDDDNDGILDIIENNCTNTGTINYEFYDSAPLGSTVDNIPTTGATATGTINTFNVNTLQNLITPGDGERYSIRYSGYINITTNETYTFFTTSDDGSKLFIGDTEVVDNDGLHGAVERSGTITLTPGLYPITVTFFELTGGDSLLVRYSSPTITKTDIPFSAIQPLTCTNTEDTDGDGIINSLDLDSDNDGITDVIESGGIDTNRDGKADGNIGTTSATRGVPNSAGTGNNPINSDLDSFSDYLDIDADNDGIPDNIEGQTTLGYVAPSGVGTGITDINNNGLDDNYENGTIFGINPENTDGEDNPDYLDLDSDNDTINDISENGNTNNIASGNDADNDGLDDNFDDTDDSGNAGSTVNDNHNPPAPNNLGDLDNDFNSIGDLDYRDTNVNGVPMITQVYQFNNERWIEVTNISKTNSIPANLIKIQLYKDKTGDQTDITPDAFFRINTALLPGQSVLFTNSLNSITGINSSAVNVLNNLITDIEGSNDILTLSNKEDNSSWANRYDIVQNISNKTSLVRIDETLVPNKTYTENEWVVFIDDALNPYEFLSTVAERHPHDPLISEIVNSNTNANTLLGLHRIEKTTRTSNIWDNGFPDRSRYVSINENYNHQTERLSARKLEVLGTNILALDNQLLVVTNNVNITDNAEIRLVGSSQLVQTHKTASQVSGNGQLFVDQNSTIASIYRYNYMSSPVTSLGTSSYTVENVFKDGTNPVSFSGVVGQSATNIARNINFVAGFNGGVGTPIQIADYWIYTFASSSGVRASWSQKFKSGTIASTDGFIFKGSGVAQNYTFLGNPNDGELTTAVGGSESYLLGNPFPSSLNALKFIKDNLNSIDGSIYLWDHVGEEETSTTDTRGHNYAGYVGGYATVNLSMAVSSVSKPNLGAFNITLEAEDAVTNGTTTTDNSLDIVTLNSAINFIEFDKISRATDKITLNYKAAAGKSIRLLVNGVEIDTYNLDATSIYLDFDIEHCIITGATIRIESLDANNFSLNNISISDDDGNISCVPSAGSDASLYKTPGTYIAIGQGFFVGGDADGGPIVFNNSQREFVTEDSGNVVFFKTDKKRKNNNSSKTNNGDFNKLPFIKLGMDFIDANGTSLHRQIGVSFSSNNSFEFEKGYDSPINDLGETDIYWKFANNDTKYVIAGIEKFSENLEIPFDIVINYDGTNILKIDDSFSVTSDIYLLDKLTNKTNLLSNNEIALQLKKGTYSDRFAIVFKENSVLSTENINNVLETNVHIFLDANSNELVLQNNNNSVINKVTIFNLLGQKVMSFSNLEPKTENRLHVYNISKTIYVVNIQTDKGFVSKKIKF